jgi:hypothetical protein
MIPDDDAPVEDDTGLYHRIPPSPDQIVPDENRGCMRLSSAAFIGKEEMSVVIEDTLRAMGREPVDILANYPGQYLVRLTAGFVRRYDQIVRRSRTDEEPAHGDVIGRKTKSVARKFAEAACWEIEPPGACPDDIC